ncbi:MAG TPA: biotin--[acetyl-CoA-carboxylase] ligase [Bacteroidales bacterium]|jgi:BirA family biotin operon repressor/biotin-[acetyl-CoA-carboxylase] ligase|nr:biotin--[acetyl-CoA-carboxylase] ligase [Bacteroidales bacterium]|tara:strand:- start:241 stop:984 length:744 start_codon:yes stop_codon:yes gene_type:complete
MQFNIINIPKLKSTNSYAQELIESGDLHEGDVISTQYQKNGRGQGDNFWESEHGSNLLVSIILEPSMVPAQRQFVLTQIVSLALVDLIKEYILTEEVKIKWPNDIYVNKNKIAGILFQNFVKGNHIEFSIAGIGINVNQKKYYSEVPNPISIIHHSNSPTNLKVLLDKLLDKIGFNYETYRLKENFEELKSKYVINLYRYNEWATYSDGNNPFQGKIFDIDEFGRLEVMMKSGEEKKFMFKEIEFVE